MQGLCPIWRIDKLHNTASQVEGNCACERLNQTIKQGLQTKLNEKWSEEWDVVLRAVMFAYNTSVYSTTGFTPYFLIFGVDARVPS